MDPLKGFEKGVIAAGSFALAGIILLILAFLWRIFKILLVVIVLFIEWYWQHFEFRAIISRICAIFALILIFSLLPVLIWDSLDRHIHHIPFDTILYSSENIYVVGAEIANIRSGPSTTYSIVGQFSKGTIVDTIAQGSSENWKVVKYNGKQSYLSKSLITLKTRNKKSFAPSSFPLRAPVWVLLFVFGCGFLVFAIFYTSVDERLAQKLNEYVPIDTSTLKYRIPENENNNLKISIG
jgi:uncharacterized protein YgiM (DUF1202 family)